MDSTAGSSFSKTPVVTREAFEQMKGYAGGDCWNRYGVLAKVFQDTAVRWVSDIDVSTGLWCHVVTNKGKQRVYG